MNVKQILNEQIKSENEYNVMINSINDSLDKIFLFSKMNKFIFSNFKNKPKLVLFYSTINIICFFLIYSKCLIENTKSNIINRLSLDYKDNKFLMNIIVFQLAFTNLQSDLLFISQFETFCIFENKLETIINFEKDIVHYKELLLSSLYFNMERRLLLKEFVNYLISQNIINENFLLIDSKIIRKEYVKYVSIKYPQLTLLKINSDSNFQAS